MCCSVVLSMECTSLVTLRPQGLFLCGPKSSLSLSVPETSAQALHYAALDIKRQSLRSRSRMTSLGSLQKGDVLEDAHQDYSVGMPVRTCAILNLCTMQFVVSNAAREPRKAASTNVRGRVGTRVKSIVKSWCTTSLYHVVILP